MKKSKLTKYIYITFASMMIFSLIISLLASGLLARFLSTSNNNDSARVAYWDIDVVDENGNDIGVNQGSSHLDSEDKGNKFFQVSNKSEVAAAFSSDSTIALKFTADTFKSTTDIASWDFITLNSNIIDNPCEFNIYIYNCEVSDLDKYLTYTKGTNVINKQTYDNLTDEEKEDYIEDVVLPSDGLITEELLLSTSDSTLIIEKQIEDGIPYFYLKKNLENADTKYTFPVNDNTYTFRLEWKIGNYSSSGSSVNTKFKAYYLIERSEYNTTDYDGYISYNKNNNSTSEQTVLSNNSNTYYYSYEITLENETKDLVLAYKQFDYFEYLIYTSSLGGEPVFTNIDFIYSDFETNSSGIYKVGYSKLSTDVLTEISNRTITVTGEEDVFSYNSLMKYKEKLQADAYKIFLESKDDFENSLGYLSIGLNCSVVYNLKVVQLD